MLVGFDRMLVATLLLCVVFGTAFGAERRMQPREMALEQILETADTWLLDHDDDDNGRLSISEMGPLLDAMKAGSSAPESAMQQMSVKMLMDLADSDQDGNADRDELVSMLKRMKGYDGGHLDRAAAAKPTTVASAPRYADSHIERMDKKRPKKRRKKEEL